ncbi:hypothetical protein MNBD_GAMMA10-1648 [hydrothermal vent metagenome]|uniref:Uncharacterized protein n=1 Tax=hydrothermal vent metagenome TaxID=652676 RepID=A0A3B0YAA7_9ZZZZ
MKDEEPALFIDRFDEGVIVGNKKGIELLRDTLDEALKNYGVITAFGVKNSDISAVLCTSKEKLNRDEECKESITDKIIIGLIFTWIGIFPFIGAGFLVNWVFFEELPHISKPGISIPYKSRPEQSFDQFYNKINPKK